MKVVKHILVAYLSLVALFTVALVGAFSIPSRVIEDNVRLSVRQVIDDGEVFSARVGEVNPLAVDVFSDCLLLGIAYCADSDHPLQAAMDAAFMMQDGSTIEGAQLMMGGTVADKPPLTVYSRYWHGNQVVLRPLLCVATVRTIRWINAALLAALLLALAAALWRRVGRSEALVITLSLLAVMVPTVPWCMNMVPTFYIALVSSLLILWRPSVIDAPRALTLFFVIGGLTAFFDLLTTPLVAMAVPAAVDILCRKPARPWRELVLMALAWLGGYALLWASKWALAGLVTGYSALDDAFGAIRMRTVGVDEPEYMRWCLDKTVMMVAAVCCIVASVSILFGRSWQCLRDHAWLLLLALAPVAWAFVLLQHSWHHLFFTWRTSVVLIMAVALFWHRTLSLRHPLSVFKRR